MGLAKKTRRGRPPGSGALRLLVVARQWPYVPLPCRQGCPVLSGDCGFPLRQWPPFLPCTRRHAHAAALRPYGERETARLQGVGTQARHALGCLRGHLPRFVLARATVTSPRAACTPSYPQRFLLAAPPSRQCVSRVRRHAAAPAVFFCEVFFFFFSCACAFRSAWLPVWTTTPLATYAELSHLMRQIHTANFEKDRYKRWWQEEKASADNLRRDLHTVRSPTLCPRPHFGPVSRSTHLREEALCRFARSACPGKKWCALVSVQRSIYSGWQIVFCCPRCLPESEHWIWHTNER